LPGRPVRNSAAMVRSAIAACGVTPSARHSRTGLPCRMTIMDARHEGASSAARPPSVEPAGHGSAHAPWLAGAASRHRGNSWRSRPGYRRGCSRCRQNHRHRRRRIAAGRRWAGTADCRKPRPNFPSSAAQHLLRAGRPDRPFSAGDEFGLEQVAAPALHRPASRASGRRSKSPL
jgi:hypothetical protein